MERASLEKQISDLQAAGRAAETGPLVPQLQAKQNIADLSSFQAPSSRHTRHVQAQLFRKPIRKPWAVALLLQQAYANTKPKEAVP